MPILSDPSKNIIANNDSRSYDKAILNSSPAMDNRKRHTSSNSQGGSVPLIYSSTTSSPPISSSACPFVNTRCTSASDTADNRMMKQIFTNYADNSTKRHFVTMAGTAKKALPPISTNFEGLNAQSNSGIKKKDHNQRLALDDDSLTTLPSPATSVHDFPTSKRYTVREKISSNLSIGNKNYQHHRTTSDTNLLINKLSSKNHTSNGNHHSNDDMGPIIGHHMLQQRLTKLGLQNYSELIGHYAVLKLIGTGSFSEVKLAIDLENCREVAIKMISLKEMQDNECLKTGVSREIKILEYINHPNIVSLLDTVETPTHLCLILEYVPGGELFDYVNEYYEKITEEEAKQIFYELVNIVSYLHESNIVHRDLKLENILLESSESSSNKKHIKLTDFGLARFINPKSPLLTTRCGSEEYAAPELISASSYDGRKTDIWSLGIILYALLVGYLPFNQEAGQTRKQFFIKIIKADFKFPNPNTADKRGSISEDAKDLVKKILHTMPERRPSLEEIKNHPWLSSLNTM
ncbi:27393_t:CDS:2 [Dentiscutata erythropus]|uniref:27393_t:CDS:1 n=1 Tax=Dentiscutata erythropus TaxID=1348616 RepID=A0A9N9GFG4_9GLOM|nr:27393_t:CDS:2 [Dentiscutata erythropus]